MADFAPFNPIFVLLSLNIMRGWLFSAMVWALNHMKRMGSMDKELFGQGLKLKKDRMGLGLVIGLGIGLAWWYGQEEE